ncbi:MAG TPA: septum formation initiator family protein [bacterium]|nr:septum formation initiator family protein [bacterium]
MTSKYNLSPTEKLNYIEKGKIKGQAWKNFKQFLLTLILLGLVILMFIPYLKNNKKTKNIETEIAQIQSEINKYEKTNQGLSEVLSYLSSDQSVEEKARLNLNLQKAGEQVVVIKREEALSNVNTSTDEIIEVSNFRKWINYFFNN